MSASDSAPDRRDSVSNRSQRCIHCLCPNLGGIRNSGPTSIRSPVAGAARRYMEFRSIPTQDVYQNGMEAYFKAYPAPDREHRTRMEEQEQISGERSEDSVLVHLQTFRSLFDVAPFNELLEQLLLHVRQRTLAGGRFVYLADAMHVMSVSDREEPEPNIPEESSTDSVYSDEIFKKDQPRLLSMFEDFLAELAIHACIRFEKNSQGYPGS